MDTRQYLYCLKPKPEFAEKAGVIKGVTVIGKLDIVWKTNLGERGRLQTSQLQRMVRKQEVVDNYKESQRSLESFENVVFTGLNFPVITSLTIQETLNKVNFDIPSSQNPIKPNAWSKCVCGLYWKLVLKVTLVFCTVFVCACKTRVLLHFVFLF